MKRAANDPLAVKITKMKNLLDYLAEDEAEAHCIMMHLVRVTIDPNIPESIVRSPDELRAIHRAANGGKTEWL